MAKCPNCGTELPDGQKFCGECGTPIPQTKKCPQCGKEWPAAQKFCGECGFNFATAAAAPAPAPAAPADDKEYETLDPDKVYMGVYTDDRDGTEYNVVKIGKQLWFAENFRGECDGVHIYDCDFDNLDNYGALYNWDSAVAMTPEGWRLPTRKDFDTLVSTVCKELDTDQAGLALISNTYDWSEESGTNAVGFNGKPSGYCIPPAGEDDDIEFCDLGEALYLWTADASDEEDAYMIQLSDYTGNKPSFSDYYKTRNYAVRYVKDIDKVEVGEITWTKIVDSYSELAESSDDEELGTSPLSDYDQQELDAAIELFMAGDFEGAQERIEPVFSDNQNNFDAYKWYMRILLQIDMYDAYRVAMAGGIADEICDSYFVRIAQDLSSDDMEEAVELLETAKEKWPNNALVYTAAVMIGCRICEKEGSDEKLEVARQELYDYCQVDLEGDDYERESCLSYAEWLLKKADRKKLPVIEMPCWHYMAFPKNMSVEIVEED